MWMFESRLGYAIFSIIILEKLFRYKYLEVNKTFFMVVWSTLVLLTFNSFPITRGSRPLVPSLALFSIHYIEGTWPFSFTPTNSYTTALFSWRLTGTISSENDFVKNFVISPYFLPVYHSKQIRKLTSDPTQFMRIHVYPIMTKLSENMLF